MEFWWHLCYTARLAAVFFLCRLTYLSRVTTAAGVIPGMRLAQPIEAGLRTANNFSVTFKPRISVFGKCKNSYAYLGLQHKKFMLLASLIRLLSSAK